MISKKSLPDSVIYFFNNSINISLFSYLSNVCTLYDISIFIFSNNFIIKEGLLSVTKKLIILYKL